VFSFKLLNNFLIGLKLGATDFSVSSAQICNFSNTGIVSSNAINAYVNLIIVAELIQELKHQLDVELMMSAQHL